MGQGGRTMSLREYVCGSTSRAFAVLTSKSGMIATALMELLHLKRLKWPMFSGGMGGVRPVSMPPAGWGRTSERGTSMRAMSAGSSSLR